ncbi:DUF3592 domain-containing protein [Schumannella soli]|uniref:DUF3592 domain-containing protein n=2 Tax=Schumannella soli TaxID=2590779 RepID=A0A506Y568_9MICO|nr:DUF3592 domain-containing protein [Schumannella soli]
MELMNVRSGGHVSGTRFSSAGRSGRHRFTSRSPRERATSIVIAIVIIVLVIGGAIAQNVWQRQHAADIIAKQTSVEGTSIACERSGGRRNRSACQLRWEYVVDGQRYTFRDNQHSYRTWQTGLEGQRAEIFYDPEHPDQAARGDLIVD